jgi:hypothetical protein
MLEDVAGSGFLIIQKTHPSNRDSRSPTTAFSATRSGSMDDDLLAKADGLHVQLHVKNGNLAMQPDADPGCRSAMLHADQVLKLAANDLEQRRLLATTLPKPGAEVKAFVD